MAQDIVHSGLDYSMERTANKMMNTAIEYTITLTITTDRTNTLTSF